MCLFLLAMYFYIANLVTLAECELQWFAKIILDVLEP